MIKSVQTISLPLIIAGLIGCHFGGRVLAPTQFPEFPWPPPRASAFTILPDEFFGLPDEKIVLLRDVDNRLSEALRRAGYAEKSYYAVPDGFALASRLEQINPDGTPKPELERWTISHRPLTEFSLSSYLRALFTTQSGYFRVIVFVITPHPFTQEDIKPSPEEVKSWISGGLNRLPYSVRMRRYTLKYACTALIYELEKKPGKEAVTLIPGNLSAGTHLEKSVILKGLRQ